MKICIDARMYGVKHAGIGRYVENLVKQLLIVDKSNDYVLLVREEDRENIKYHFSTENLLKASISKIKNNVKIVIANVRHYSINEQLLIPYLLAKEKPDLVHFPHFNVPLLYQGKFVVTIHDLLWHDMKGREVTTLPGYLYDIKYAGYRLVFANSVKRAQKILVPSEWVKNKLIKTYSIDSNKIVVTYEGVDEAYFSKQKTRLRQDFGGQADNSKQITKRYNLTRPFLIYTGSTYPHKNLKVLLQAIKELKNIQLLIACSRDVFWSKLKKQVEEIGVSEFVRLPGFVPDEDLQLLYQNAVAFVFPSLSEGFGLPGLEAMASGCPVLCSDIPVFHEVYGDATLYFNPKDVNSMKKNVEFIINNVALRGQLRKKGLEQSKKYSWQKMAKETLEVYEQVQEL